MVHPRGRGERHRHRVTAMVHTFGRRSRHGHDMAAMVHTPGRGGRHRRDVAAVVHLHRAHAHHSGPVESTGVDIAVGHPHGAGGREGKDLLET